MPESCAQCGASFGSVADLVEHTKTAHPTGAPAETTATSPLTTPPPKAVELPAAEPATAEPPPPPPDPEFAVVDAAGEPESTPKLNCQFCGASFTDGQRLAEHNRTHHLAPTEGVTAE
ncbi:MAG: C2H2-type zinc finger protein [Thermoplasmata archaeon]|nr:C2H2-type zinc finger protein [Thermoplasmata archaeon]MCI4344368.1 C2H2-type zinc finger protein [Thermoplasmata archaeon]